MTWWTASRSSCPTARCARAPWCTTQAGRQVLVFGNTSALYESDMVMYDHQTGSYWFQVAGEAIVGELTGRRLKPLPSITISWGEWKALHPDTLVLSRNLRLLPDGRRYDTDPFERIPRERLDTVGPPFPVSAEKMDVRLRASDKVFASRWGTAARLTSSFRGGSGWSMTQSAAGVSWCSSGGVRVPEPSPSSATLLEWG